MNKVNISEYETIIFDCDGVILNSNEIKTNAFYKVARVYGHLPAQKLKEYHQSNGGISRYEKFKYLFSNILARPERNNEINHLVESYSNEVYKDLLQCEIADKLNELRELTKNANWMVVSGSDQIELRNVFSRRGLDTYFNFGIFGSPHNKIEILQREINFGNISQNSLFIGDTLYDYEAAKTVSIDFVFLSKWSEVKDWRINFKNNVFLDIKDMIS